MCAIFYSKKAKERLFISVPGDDAVRLTRKLAHYQLRRGVFDFKRVIS